MKLKKCPPCDSYTFKANCPKCNIDTKEAHYKFLKLKDAPKSDPKHFMKK